MGCVLTNSAGLRMRWVGAASIALVCVTFSACGGNSLAGLGAEECNARGGIMKPRIVETWNEKHYDYDSPLECVSG